MKGDNMKKIVWSLVFVMCASMMTGCGAEADKTLSCSKDFSSSMPSGVTMVQESDIEFKSGKVDTMKMVMKFELSGLYASQFDTMFNTMKSTYENQYNYDGITVTASKTGDKTFDVVVFVDYKNISDATKTAIGAKGSESYSVNKTQLEQQGYTCK